MTIKSKGKKKVVPRQYRQYSNEDLAKALEQLQKPDELRPSLREVSSTFNIPYQTLHDKMKGLHPLKVGRPRMLTDEEEEAIARGIAYLGDWGFPVGPYELKKIIQNYLNKQNVTVPAFHDNLPGKDFITGFLERHRATIRLRIVPNYSKKRASVSVEDLNRYFNNLENSLRDIPKANIWNYDETNLSDNPGRKKCFIRKGVKYPKRIMNETKSCISLMICGSAAGQLMPPFVVYKAKFMYSSWRKGGPKGTRYASTLSGWFDSNTFEEWYFYTALPIMRKQDGVKVLLVRK